MKQGRKLTSVLLTLAMLLTLAPALGGTAKADSTAPAITLGMGAVAKDQTVWFGASGTDPLAWRVLSPVGNNTLQVSGSGDVLLIRQSLLNDDKPIFRDSYTNNAWAGSNTQTWCTNYYNNWPDAVEKAAIKATSVTEVNDKIIPDESESPYCYSFWSAPAYYYFAAASLNGEHFFFLSAEEAKTYFGSDDDRVAYLSPSEDAGRWWLRSPHAVHGGFAGAVEIEESDFGSVNFYAINGDECYARPAFNLDLNKVLFASPAENGKNATGTLAAIGTYAGTDWKLTLLDATGHSGFAVTETAVSAAPGVAFTLNYTGAVVGTNEYVSAILCNSAGAPLYYSRLVQPTSASGTLTVKVPAALDDGSYTLKLFSEKCNGDYNTDYASAFDDVTLTVADDAAHITTWRELYDALRTGGAIVLGADVTYGDGKVGNDSSNSFQRLVIPKGKSVTLDLNGYVIDRGLSSGAQYGYVIQVNNDRDETASLTITDGRPAAPHSIPYTDLPAGGVITGGWNDSDGGGVYVYEKGEFNMSGGTICGNHAHNGGGVYTDDGVINMSGGTICGNHADNGGGVYNDGEFNMSGTASITGNNTEGKGGGVYNNDSFTMSGNASISGNTAAYAGGGVSNDDSFTMSGTASISGNTAAEEGGGVYVSDKFQVSGGARVTGNTKSGEDNNNVYLCDSKKLYVTEGLTSGASFGVTMHSPGVFTSGLAAGTASARGTASNFFSDAALTVALNGGEATLPCGVTITPGEHMTKTTDSGAETQNSLTVPMTPVVYTAETGYYFPTNYSASSNGVASTRNSYTQITVSGQPTVNTTITLPAATAKTQESTPGATFTATGPDCGTLSSLADGGRYVVSGAATADFTLSGSTSHDLTGVSAGTLSVVKKGNGNTTTDSPAQSITVTRAAAPALTVTQAASADGTGSVATTTAHEWSANGTDGWTTCTGELTGLAQNTTRYVRVKASGTVLASENQTVTINTFGTTPETTPNATFSATGPDCGELSGLVANADYKISGAGLSPADVKGDANGKYAIASGLTEGTLSVVKKGNGNTTADSEPQTITVGKAATPTGLTAAGCTTSANKDGKITGLNSGKKYEYKTTGDYTPVEDGATEITGLTPGTYYVRVKASGTALASGNQTLTVAAYSAPTTYAVTYDANGATGGSVPTDANNYADGAQVTVLGNTGSLVRSGYTFNNWNTKADGSGTPYKAGDTFAIGADVTLFAQWTKNAAPTPKPTPTPNPRSERPERGERDNTPATVTISDGDGSVKLSVTVDGGKVTLGALTSDQLKDVAASDKPVVLDLSSLGKDVTSVSIPADTFVKLAEALAQRPDGADRTVTIETAVGGVTFDAKALAAIAAGAKSGFVTMDFALTGYDQLSPTQQASFQGQQVMGSFALSMLVGGASVSSLDGGRLVVSLPFTPAPGTEGRFYKVWFVADNGAKERMPSAFAGNTLSVELPHCSDYVLVYEDQIPVPKQVVLSPQKITVNGAAVTVEAYNIDGTNYFKLRDLAALLKGTPAQFNVDYDASRNAVVMTRSTTYAGEAAAQFTDKSASTVPSPQTVELDGKDVSFTAYNIGGNNFFGLRELAAYLGYGVDYDEATNTAIIESK